MPHVYKRGSFGAIGRVQLTAPPGWDNDTEALLSFWFNALVLNEYGLALLEWFPLHCNTIITVLWRQELCLLLVEQQGQREEK